MIYTNEPANVFYVYLAAHRAVETLEVNEKMLKGMIAKITKYPGMYGNIESQNVTGCYREHGQQVASKERTLRVRCTKEAQVAELTYLACHEYDQDVVLVVNSQTHTAALASIRKGGEYPLVYPEYHEARIGVLTVVDAAAGECCIIDEQGVCWGVL